MTYRERVLRCPRCRVDLQVESAEVARCGKCAGVFVAVPRLLAELVKIDPALVPAEGAAAIRTVRTMGRRATEPALACAACGEPMAPIFLGGRDVDRCYHDDAIWFDRGEHAGVLAAAEAQAHPPPPLPWWKRLLS